MATKRRMKLSFSKSELKRGQLKLGNAGVMMAMPTEAEKVQEFIASFGYKPDHVKPKTQFQFGWFGSSSSSNEVYPDLDIAKSLMPKEEDFVNVPFRMLSATVVAAGTWRSTDFTDTEVLKRAVNKLANKPVYKEHDTDLDNCVGLVKNPKFSEAFTASDGQKIPAGLDGIISIDGKCNYKLARNVLSGAVYSDSVTVEFDWVPSHIFEGENADYDFERNVGKIIDGRMVCRKVVEIIDFYEVSLVWLGADPYAKQIDTDGDLINVDNSSTYSDDVVQTHYKKEGKYEIRLGLAKNVLSLSKFDGKFNQNSLKTGEMKITDKALEALRKKLKLADGAEITDAHIVAIEGLEESAPDNSELANAVSELTGEKIEANAKPEEILAKLKSYKGVKTEEFSKLSAALTDLSAEKEKSAALQGEVGTLKADKAALEASIAEMKPKVVVADSYISAERKEVKRLYNLSMGGKPVAAVEAIIEKATIEELAGLKAQYTKNVTENFSGKCKSCGSSEFEFKSSVHGDVNDDGSVSNIVEQYGTDFNSIHEKYDKAKKQ